MINVAALIKPLLPQYNERQLFLYDRVPLLRSTATDIGFESWLDKNIIYLGEVCAAVGTMSAAKTHARANQLPEETNCDRVDKFILSFNNNDDDDINLVVLFDLSSVSSGIKAWKCSSRLPSDKIIVLTFAVSTELLSVLNFYYLHSTLLLMSY